MTLTKEEIRVACFVTGNTQGILRRFDHPLKAYVSQVALTTYRSQIIKTKHLVSKKKIRVLIGPLRDRLDALEPVIHEGG